MKHYINPTTKDIYAYELDGSQDSFIAAGLEPISEADLAILRAPTPAQITATAHAAAKEQRTVAVAAIKVTTAAGHTFDGDEISQGRMTRAIVALQATSTPSTLWVLANNTAISASASELVEALALAGAAQAALWVIA
jgi:hypothetical protein